MSRFALWTHVVIACVGLLFAWWRQDYVAARGLALTSAVLLDASPGDVASVKYTWDKGNTEVTTAGTGDERVSSVRVDREISAKPSKDDKDKDNAKDNADAAKDASTTTPAAREQAVVRGGKVVNDAMDTLEPLRSKRTLGVVPEAQREAMGLSKSTRTVVVTTRKGATVTLRLGDAAYGSQGRYAMVDGSDVVHLLDNSVAAALEGGPDVLAEKRVVTLPIERIGALVVRKGASTRTFRHVNADQTSLRQLQTVVDGRPSGERNDAAGKLLTTLRNLKGTQVVDAAPASEPLVVFAVDNQDGKRFPVELFAKQSGGYVVRANEQVQELPETSVRELLSDVDAALE
jgi:hypothetical protein